MTNSFAARIRRWLRGITRHTEASGQGPAPGRYPPIGDYGLIGDRVTTALVSKAGSIDWACFPRMDSPSVFGRLLDWDNGGHWQIAPVGEWESAHTYRADTPILETTFTTPTGSATLVDFMPPHFVTLERPGDSAIIRTLTCTAGEVAFDLEFRPRFNYARSAGRWQENPGTGVRASNFDESVTLYGSGDFEIAGDIARTSSRLSEGESITYVMTYRRPCSLFWATDLTQRVPAILKETEDHWLRWIDQCLYRGPYEPIIRRSAITLRLLDYAPTGAIVAAPTTSLPEWIGGDRNWDYRFSWLRDTAFALYALYVLGYREEGEAFLGWIFDMTQGEPAELRVLYGVGGERECVEFELSHLDGYRGSKPVRVGNAAQVQRQLDIYGDLVDCAYLLVRYGGAIGPDLWRLLRNVVDHVCEAWVQPDYGVWEVRSDPRHFTYSKAMCWVAIDRGIRLAERCGFEADLPRWRKVAAQVHEAVMKEGFDPERGAFTQAFGYKDLDAAVLAFPLRRVIEATDPRFISTVEKITAELATDGLLHRVSPTFEDGVGGGEGAFLLVSFWLVDAYTLMGRVEEARALFDRLLTYSNDLGLFAEMVDPRTGELLGNFPQAFTHIACIGAAVNLARAESALSA